MIEGSIPVANVSIHACEDEDILVQLFLFFKVGCSIVPERTRVNPKTREVVTCKPTVKPKAQFSINFRQAIQENYDKSRRNEKNHKQGK